MHKIFISIFVLYGYLGSSIASAHGGHDPVFSLAWLSWEHWLAHATAVPVVLLGVGLAVAGAWLLVRLHASRVALFVRRVRGN